MGLGNGKTAAELGIEVVAHETNHFLAYESITRAHSGEPNVLTSREGAPGELAAFRRWILHSLGKSWGSWNGINHPLYGRPPSS